MEANSIFYKVRPRRKNYKDTSQQVLNRDRAERRQKVLVDRRRIPLNEVQQEPNMDNVDNKPTGAETAPRITSVPPKRQPAGMEEAKKRAAAKRIEQLRAWKKERDLVKMKSKEKAKKPFIPAGLNYSSISKLTTTSLLATSSHPTSVSRKLDVATTKSASSGISLRNRTVKPTVPEKPVRLKQGSGTADSEIEPSRKPRPAVTSKLGRQNVSKSTVCNSSVRGPTTRARVALKPAVGRNTKPSSPPMTRTVAKLVSGSKVTKPRANDSKSLSPSENDRCDQVNAKSSEMILSPKMSARTLTSRPPLAPKPSPEVIGQKLNHVDLAWIPGQKFATPAPTDPSVFERAFGKHQLFSPYVFTGGKKKTPAMQELPGFTFRLECTDSPDFSMVEDRDEADVSTASVTAFASNPVSLDNVGILDISDSSQEKMNANISHNNEKANRLVAGDDNTATGRGFPESSASEAVNPDSLSRSTVTGNAESLADNLPENCPKSVSSPSSSAFKTTVDSKADLIRIVGNLPSPQPQNHVLTTSSTRSEVQQKEAELTKETGFSFFRNLHDVVCKRWQVECDKWNGISAELESQQLASEEALDHIRTTVCQSQLLMRSKLKQYLGLVKQAEERTGEKIPTAEDLQGFWDMVYLQVEDVDKKFSGLDELKANNWQIPKATKPVSSKPRRSKRLATTSPQSSNPQAVSDRLKQQRAKRAAARTKFLQMKAAASAAATQKDAASEQDRETEGKCVKEETEVAGTTVQVQKTNHFVVQTMDNTTANDCPDGVDGAFMRKYVSIKPSKKLQEMLGTDCVLSPARRSLRIHRKSVGQSLSSDPTSSASNNSIVVTSLNDLPHNLDYAIHPNPSLQ